MDGTPTMDSETKISKLKHIQNEIIDDDDEWDFTTETPQEAKIPALKFWIAKESHSKPMIWTTTKFLAPYSKL